ncbi:MAG: ATP-binding protein [Thermodesulfobacteriota bacterium]
MPKAEAKRQRSILNILVIALMLFMAVFTSIFIYSNLHLKKKITYRIVQQTELISDLISRSVLTEMKNGHEENTYSSILEYGNLIGVKNIAIYNTKGIEAFENPNSENGTPVKRRNILNDHGEHFKKVIETMDLTSYFDHDDQEYERFEPLYADGACLKCHSAETEILGVLKFSLSTEDDFQVLSRVQRFIWILGVIICLPIGGIIVTGAIIRDKNKLFNQLNDSNENLQRTYHDLNDTKYYLEMILNNSKVTIITTDTEGKVVEFNKEAQNLLGYSKAEIVGHDVRMLYDDPEERPYVKGQQGGVWSARNKEVKLKAKSGKIIHISLTLSTLVNDHGEVIGTVGIGKDISEQKMLQFKLLQSEKLAGIGTLASGIAHEINNPLAGILGMAEAIKDEDDMELVQSYTDDIIQYSMNASVIVKELSTYSRSAQNEATSTVDVTSIIKNSIKMAKHAAPFQAINEEIALEEKSFIFANTGELQQVFVNLIVNAIHSMEKEGTLAISCAREGDFVKSVISDTGAGISEENMSQVFDPFFTTKPAGSGTGLGLYVVYRIVTKYGGTIDINSTVGKGTSFTIKFPAAEGSDTRVIKA